MNALKTFLSSRPRSTSGRALLDFLSGKVHLTSHKNATHLYQSLYPLCVEYPDLVEITYSDLVAWAEKLTLGYSVGSIRSKLIDIRTFFHWCAETGRIRFDVSRGLKLPRSRPRDKAAKEEDYLIVVRCLAELLRDHVSRNVFGQVEIVPGSKWLMRTHVHALRDLFLLVLLYETGCRAGEVAKLSTRAMNQALASPAGFGDSPVYTLAVMGKTGVRYRSFTKVTANLWGLWCSVRPKAGSEYALVKWKKEGEQPQRLCSDDVTRIVTRRCIWAGVTIFRPHALRHAKAQRAKRLGGVHVAMTLLDHHDVTSTLFYTADDEAEMNAAARATGFVADLW